MANVGKQIRLLRKQKNMTQDELAELLYVSRQTVSNYENGKSNPDIDMLVRIAEVLETDVSLLIFGPSVSLSRRREGRKLLFALLALLILGVLYVQLLAPAKEWQRNTFDHGPAFALLLLLRPAGYLLSGFAAMQAVSFVWGIRRRDGRPFRVLCASVLVLLMLYAFLTVPFCVVRLAVSVQLSNHVDHSALLHVLPEFWNRAAIGLWYGLSKGAVFLFLPGGAVLWNQKGSKS